MLGWEETFTCPYNISHQITGPKLQRHLVKCRRNHPNSDVVVCSFNSCHHVPFKEKEYHLQTCPDRKLVEVQKYELRDVEKRKTHYKPARKELDDDEDWEKEAIVKHSYDPKKKASQLPVLMKLEGATPSQRKEFRAKEKVRHEELAREVGMGIESVLRRPLVNVKPENGRAVGGGRI